MDAYFERIKPLFDSSGESAANLERKIGIPAKKINQWNARYTKSYQKYIPKIASYFHVSTDYLLGNTDDPRPNAEKAPTQETQHGVKIPVLGDVAAGIPIEAITDILDYEEIDEAMARTGDFFGLRIKGASMEPRMQEGDVVIVRRQETADTGDTVVALVNGDSATVKKIKYGPDGITLIPTNPLYDPMFYSAAEVESLPVRVIGRVVELRAKY